MTIDTTKLRELAMKATPGPWYSKWPEERCAWKDIGHSRHPVAYTGDCFDDAPNAEYIAATNPSTVLALLDDRDELERMFHDACHNLAAINFLLMTHPEKIMEEISRLKNIEAAARNLVKVKGSRHAEIAYQKLVEVLG